MAKYSDIPSVEEGTGLISNNNETVAPTKESKALKISGAALLLGIAFMMGTRLNSSSEQSVIGQIGPTVCTSVSAIATNFDGSPFTDVLECTENGGGGILPGDFQADCYKPIEAGMIGMIDPNGWGWKTNTSCKDQGFDVLDRTITPPFIGAVPIYRKKCYPVRTVTDKLRDNADGVVECTENGHGEPFLGGSPPLDGLCFGPELIEYSLNPPTDLVPYTFENGKCADVGFTEFDRYSSFRAGDIGDATAPIYRKP